ncbi:MULTISPECIES: hypothetical protein [Microbacterium]|uniref:hypothetical protein n=1 Tax=Microbacterium TaxID=33882 RepID=UPI00277E0505|nr:MULTISPECIES: hypothetical protein [Microbacterium]MDQ1083820.1 hypothetical protein [Microbacterium sp. SORGH_AS_0344]MDQ1170901.1 hypothetical protein [Microbacterium proteolyticum]
MDTGLPGFDPFKVAVGAPFILKDSIDHHNALMSADESVNGPVLSEVQKALRERGH